LAKYRVEVGSFVTRFVQRKITVHADNEKEAGDKALEKFLETEAMLVNSNDPGEPQVDGIELMP